MKTFAVTIVAIALAGVTACSGDTSMDVKAPTELTVAALEGGAHLTWKDNSDNEAEFMIERMTTAVSWMTVGTVPFDTTQYHDPNLTAGMMYVYRVMGMPKSGGHESGKGAYSNEATFTAPSTGPNGTAGSTGTGGSGTGGAGARMGAGGADAGGH